MQINDEERTWPFDVSKTKLSANFLAGRGKALLEKSKSPLQAQEFAKRKKIQEMLLKGELKLDQNNIPKELLRLNTPYTILKNAKADDVKASVIPGNEFKNDLGTNWSLAGSTSSPSTLECSDQYTGTVAEKKNMQMSSPTISVKSNGYLPKENTHYSRKNGTVSKPLRRPDKSRKQYVIKDKTKSNDIRNVNQSNSEVDQEGRFAFKDKDAWIDWENSVVVQGALADEDLPEIATVEDNDDINDVIVNQYIDALQCEQNNEIPHQNNSKLTPNRVQQFSKLKSTSNADCVRVSPGTQPNLPKGDNRWGGTELNGMSSNTGWGIPANVNRNQYDDGSSVWSAGGSQYGGVSWSEAS